MSGLAHPATLLLVCLAGAAFTIFVQHGVLWLGRKDERMHLWVALWGLAAVAHASARVLQYGAANVPAAAVGLRLTLGALVLTAVVGVSAVRYLTREQGHPMLMAGSLPLHGVMLYLALATETLVTGVGDPRTDVFGRLYPWVDFGAASVLWLPWAAAVLGYCGYIVSRAKDLDEGERRLLWGGLAAFGAAGALDWCQGMGLFRGPLLLDYTLVGIAFAFSFLASRRYEAIQDNLEGEVKKRTVELTEANEALAVALREARDNAATKSRFMSTLSHEIRTPLNGMMASTQLLMDSDLNPSAQRLARIAARSSQTLKTIVDDVLDLAAVEAGVLTVRPQAMDAMIAIDDTVRMFEDQASQTGTRLEVATAREPLPDIIADPVRVKQILANLVSNALKYAGGGHVVIRTRSVHTAEGGFLRFEVQDDGPGMSEAQSARVFEAFHKRVHVDTTGSTGLGLAISREMVARLGGHIGVNSKEGAGATFWFELPVGDPAAARASLGRHETDSMGRIPAQIGGGRRILIAEDNAVNQEVAKLLLKRLGFSCDIVDDGVAAVRKAESGRYSAVLMDVRLPGMDGLKATRAIRQLGGAAGQVPIIAITANAFDKHRQAAHEAGMNAFIPKPIDIGALAATLFELLGNAPENVPQPETRDRVSPVSSARSTGSLRAVAPRTSDRLPTPPPARPGPTPAPVRTPARQAAPPRPPAAPRAASPSAGRASTPPPPASERFVLSRPPPTLAPDRGEQTLRPVKSAPVPSINADIEIAAMGEEDEDVDLLELFLEDSRSRLSLLSRATASGDTAMVVGAAHAMKGAAASIGLEAIRDVCETLERDAEQGRVPDPSQLNQLIRLIEQL